MVPVLLVVCRHDRWKRWCILKKKLETTRRATRGRSSTSEERTMQRSALTRQRSPLDVTLWTLEALSKSEQI